MSPSISPNATFSQDVRTQNKAQGYSEGNAQSQTKNHTENITESSPKSGPVGQPISELSHNKKAAEIQEPIAVTQKKQLNAAIIESSLKFSNTIGDQPLSLVLKTALQGINEALKAGDVENTVEVAYDTGIDFSPEATAERIVSFSTQFLGSFREQHPEMNEEESLTAFVDIISGGIDQGFGEAKDILEGLKVLDGEIATNIDKTYELVQEGLQSFVNAFKKTEE